MRPPGRLVGSLVGLRPSSTEEVSAAECLRASEPRLREVAHG
jgi:hypothetical protein